MGRLPHQSAPTWVIVKIIQLLPPETLRVNRLRMYAALPEAMLTILSCCLPQRCGETRWRTREAVVSKLLPCILAKIGQGSPQTIAVKVLVEQDGMKVSGHDDVGIDGQMLVLVAEVEAVNDDAARLLCNKDGQPFDDGESDKVEGVIRVNLVT